MATMALFTAGSLLVGGLVASSYRANVEDIEEPRPEIGDARIQTSGNAIPIPILYGQQAIAGNIIWTGALHEVKHQESQDVGGKGGGGDTITRTWYTYYGSFAVALCEGPLDPNSIVKITANDEVVFYNASGSGDLTSIDAYFYPGTETQMPSAIIELEAGAGNVPAFRGLAYIVFSNFDLSPYGNQYPNFQVELIGK